MRQANALVYLFTAPIAWAAILFLTWSSSAETAVAVPPIADSEVVSEIIARLSDPNPSAELTRAARQLVAAAAAGTVGADRVAAVFDPRRDDVDSALHLCVLADLAT